ncbi:hypothetical protein [Serratia sp. AKBS12]|uniref:hypothetical protein n=1 Tax=Serratia sp. AKBS12 TaxID=2974597 RepID=UPI0021658D2A|nr:hypothetical protein [Serratia sp. AKBS12]MCS3405880.1 hypothetical protein [Serratia sp. AKBS12]HEI8866682.1 hypothetical protein [Serratia odorifera]
MSLDTASFPWVWMRQPVGQPRDVADEFAEFDALLARQQPFVLLCALRITDEQEPDRDRRTQVALWKRDRRDALKKYVKGMVMIEPDVERRSAAEQFADFASRFWGYPIEVVADETQARQRAQNLLSL